MSDSKENIIYKIGCGYTLSKIGGKDCIMVLRDQNDDVICVMDVCNNKISRIEEERDVEITNKARKALVNFIKNNNYKITLDVAKLLKLSVWKIANEEEKYLTESELLKLIKSSEENLNLIVLGVNKTNFKIPDYLHGGVFDMRDTQIKNLEIGQECNLNLDMRDNPYIKKIMVNNNFTGDINLSRSNVEKIKVADNCRINLTLKNSLKCFALESGDVFSGNVMISNSCFHQMSFGYYCYAKLELSQNWGQKEILIGDAFRGDLNINSVYAPSVKVGKNCRGKISISSSDSVQGVPVINIGDDFNGELDVSASKSVEWIEVGAYSKGKINGFGSPSIKVIKFDKMYSGLLDVSLSSIEYLRAKEGCSGRFVLNNCTQLKLLKLPKNQIGIIDIERNPMRIEKDGENVYYRYNELDLPQNYFTLWYMEAKNYIKERFFS